MKKHLIAAAVAAAVAAPAMAQVTVYGIIDAGYADSKNKGTTGAAVEVSKGVIQGGTLSSSRLGFRGEEDLGGGLKASFVAEAGLGALNAQSNNNAFFSTSQASGNRQTFVALSGGFGEVRVGYFPTANHATRGAYDVTGGANIPGNIAHAVGIPGTGAAVTGANAATNGASTDGTLTNMDYTPRANQVMFTTARMSGVQFGVGTTRSDIEIGAEKAGTRNGYALMANYVAGPLSAHVAYEDGESKTGTAGQKNDLTNWTVGAKYNFGVAEVSFTLYQDENESSLATARAGEVENKGYNLGIAVPAGAVRLVASYSDGSYRAGTTNLQAATNPKRDQSGFNLGALYSLSKRTTAYALYGQQKRDRGAAADAATTWTGKDSAVAVGLRHSF